MSCCRSPTKKPWASSTCTSRRPACSCRDSAGLRGNRGVEDRCWGQQGQPTPRWLAALAAAAAVWRKSSAPDHGGAAREELGPDARLVRLGRQAGSEGGAGSRAAVWKVWQVQRWAACEPGVAAASAHAAPKLTRASTPGTRFASIALSIPCTFCDIPGSDTAAAARGRETRFSVRHRCTGALALLPGTSRAAGSRPCKCLQPPHRVGAGVPREVDQDSGRVGVLQLGAVQGKDILLQTDGHCRRAGCRAAGTAQRRAVTAAVPAAAAD